MPVDWAKPLAALVEAGAIPPVLGLASVSIGLSAAETALKVFPGDVLLYWSLRLAAFLLVAIGVFVVTTSLWRLAKGKDA